MTVRAKRKSLRHVLTDWHSTFAEVTGKAEKPHIDRVGKMKNQNKMILKLDGGKVELRKDNGSYVRTIVSSKAVDADLNNSETLIVITYLDGKVELRKENGSYVRTIVSSKAKRAKFQGSDIAVTLDSGKIELRKENGSYIRTI